MFERQKSYLLYGNRFCGIEHTTRHGKDYIYATALKQSKNELNIDKQLEADTIKVLAEQLSKNQHVVLVINNNNVLSKTIESENQQDSLKLVYKAFPNINSEDFYYEVLSENNRHFIALCRKAYIDSIIAEYAEQKVFITDVSLGNHLVSTVKSYVETDEIVTSNAVVTITDSYISEIEKTEVTAKSYDINNLQVDSNRLLSFSGALQSVLKNNATSTNFSDRKETLLKHYKESRFFNQFIKFAGLFILGLLVVNFFMFNHYFNKVNDLEQLSEINTTTKQRVQTLNEVVSKKQKMVDDLLKSSGSKSSYYSNVIVQSLPQTVLLSEFNYQPLLKRIKADKAIELESNVISVSGTSNDSEAFSNWISQLENTDWITKVAIEDYGFASRKTSDFIIKIMLANDR